MKMMANFKAPDDLDDQYIAWRATQQGQGQAQQPTTQDQTQPTMNVQTGGGGTTQTNTGNTNTQQGSLTQQPSGGGLGVDVTGGKSAMDFMGETDKMKEDQKTLDEKIHI